jgi:hypothetical protein
VPMPDVVVDVLPAAWFGCVVLLTGAEVGLPFTPLAVGLFGLIGWLGPVGIAGAPGVPTVDELGEVAEGVTPVPAGAVVAAPVPAEAGPPAVPAAACAKSGREAAVNRQRKLVICFIKDRRSQFY